MGKWRGQEEEAGTPRSWDLPKVELFIWWCSEFFFVVFIFCLGGIFTICISYRIDRPVAFVFRVFVFDLVFIEWSGELPSRGPSLPEAFSGHVWGHTTPDTRPISFSCHTWLSCDTLVPPISGLPWFMVTCILLRVPSHPEAKSLRAKSRTRSSLLHYLKFLPHSG